MNTKRKVIALARVSTDQQDNARQMTDLSRVAASHHLEYSRTVSLDGVSGRAVMEDPEFRSVLKDLERGDCAGVAVSALG